MRFWRICFAVVVLATLSVDAQAYWGIIVDSASYGDDLSLPGAAEDGSGGVVVAWASDVTLLVYATRYDATGSVVWGPVEIGTIDAVTHDAPQIVRQGSNWFVAWFDPDVDHTVDIYKVRIAKLDSGGNVVASTAYAVALDVPVTVEDLTMVARTGGGVAVGWRISGADYVQLYSSSLSSPPISLDTSDWGYYGTENGTVRLVADDDDGVYGIWSLNIYPPFVKAQRYDALGVPLWSVPSTVFSYYPGGGSEDVTVASDGAGGFVAVAQWDYSGSSHVRVQHVLSDGTPAWNEGASASGMPVCVSCPAQFDPEVVVNSSKTAVIVSWSQGGAIQAQRLLLEGSFSPSWGSTGIQVNLGSYFEMREHRSVSNINDQTTFAWSYRSFAYTEAGIGFQVVGDDGDVEMDVDGEGLVELTSGWFEVPILVGQSVGAYAAWHAYLDPSIDVGLNSLLPPRIYDVEYQFNEVHCSNRISWRTLAGSSENKVKYHHINAGAWQTKNATSIDGTWVASVPQPVPIEFKINTKLGGTVYESDIYQDFGTCGEPDIEGAPPAEGGKATEVYFNAHPNPFNPQVIVDYRLPVTALVDLVIFDASGRRIKTLVSETKSAGTYSETWNGHDERGERVSSGVYFSRLTVNGKSITQKLVLLK